MMKSLYLLIDPIAFTVQESVAYKNRNDDDSMALELNYIKPK